MRAMVVLRFGGPDVLELRDVDRPEPGPGQILVRVIASTVNPVDAKLRADGNWANLKPPVILGYDVAGVVEEIGPCVSDFHRGDEVYYTLEIFGNPRGSYAEYNAVNASIVARKPKGLSFIEPSAIPLAGGTAREAIMRRLGIRAGETILIHAGAGGVGSFAVQFAKAAGARVFATASAQNLDILRSFGADLAIDYRMQNAAEIALAQNEGSGVDAAFDIEGDNIVARCLPALRPFGRVACILPPQSDLALVYQKNITLYGIFLSRERRRLDEMRPLFERGQARPLIDTVLPLEALRQAHERLDSHHGRGKIVLQVARDH